MDIDLLRKYFQNDCSEDEVNKIISWFKDIKNNSNDKAVFEQAWDELKDFSDSDRVNFNELLDKIHHKINLDDSTKTNLYLKPRFSRRVLNIIIKAAAILFIPLAIYSLYQNSNVTGLLNTDHVYTEVFAPNGSRTSFNLPDGSKVWLNNGSSLKFPTKFSAKRRVVELSGEAYFDVTHNENKHFIVKTGEIQVVVYGTEFNVMAYNDDKSVEIALKEGSVSLNKELNNGSTKQLLKLKPNQYAVFNKESNEVTYNTGDISKYIAWKEGVLTFENEKLDVMAKRISKHFNIDFEIEDKELVKYSYTATFVDETVPQILDLLKLATPIEYEIIKGGKLKNNTYSKTKVIIRKKR